MKKRLPWIFAAGLLICLAFLMVRLSERKKLDYWIKGEWYDETLSREENMQKRAAVLRRIGPAVVNALREDTRRQDTVFDRWYWNSAKWLQDVLPHRPRGYAESARQHAAGSLGELGPDAKAAVPDLLRLLQDKEDWVRCQAALALGAIGDESNTNLSALKALYNDPAAHVRVASVLSIWRLNRQDSSAATLIESALSAKTGDISSVVFAASLGLGSMGQEASLFAPALAEGMSNVTDTSVRSFGAKALWQMQGSAAPALDVLGVITNALTSASSSPSSTGPGSTSLLHMELCLAAHVLMEIPAFRTAVKPHLCSLTNSPHPNIARLASNNLYRIERISSGEGSNR